MDVWIKALFLECLIREADAAGPSGRLKIVGQIDGRADQIHGRGSSMLHDHIHMTMRETREASL